MSNIHKMINDAEAGRVYTTGVNANELYDAWNESGRAKTHDIIVVQSYISESFPAFDFRLVEREPECDEYNGDMLQVTLSFIGIVATVCVIIGWLMS